MNSVKLKIADVVIDCRSGFPLKRLTKKERGYLAPERYGDAVYRGAGKAEIIIDVDVVKKLPPVDLAKTLFVTYHTEDGLENWRIIEARDGYIYFSPVADKKQIIFINPQLNRAKAYVLPKKGRFVWHIGDIIYDFIQILLIHYFAMHKLGIFIHAAGIKYGRHGIVFAGESGAGKSTTSRLWHRYSDAIILNDDRVIARCFGKKFKIYGSPWHGEFGNYLADSKVSVELEKLFFIRQAKKNDIQPLQLSEAFAKLYPALFPTFWDKACLGNIVELAQSMLERVPSFKFDFCKKKSAVDFVRVSNSLDSC